MEIVIRLPPANYYYLQRFIHFFTLLTPNTKGNSGTNIIILNLVLFLLFNPFSAAHSSQSILVFFNKLLYATVL